MYLKLDTEQKFGPSLRKLVDSVQRYFQLGYITELKNMLDGGVDEGVILITKATKNLTNSLKHLCSVNIDNEETHHYYCTEIVEAFSHLMAFHIAKIYLISKNQKEITHANDYYRKLFYDIENTKDFKEYYEKIQSGIKYDDSTSLLAKYGLIIFINNLCVLFDSNIMDDRCKDKHISYIKSLLPVIDFHRKNLKRKDDK